VILSDIEIQRAIHNKEIIIEPTPTEEQYNTSALDLMLGDEIYEYKSLDELAEEEPAGVERSLIIDPLRIDVPNLLRRYGKPLPKQSDGSFTLGHNRFVIGITREYIKLPRRSKIAARVEGRSTLARLGLAVHLTAPTIHAGFEGNIILEMYNFGHYPIRLTPGRLAICQLIFERVSRVPKGPVRTKYIGQKSIR